MGQHPLAGRARIFGLGRTLLESSLCDMLKCNTSGRYLP